MRERKLYGLGGVAALLTLLGLVAGLVAGGVLSADTGAPARAIEGVPNPIDGEGVLPEQVIPGGASLIYSYGVKFTCLEPLQPGTVSFGTAAPVVKQTTEVVIHNPHRASGDGYKK